ncbi:MAG: hypothetical protein IAE82_07420 [Opitutaceae bacterium]|nr:hypothetical protein [Opitutaceae bacterium]
MNGSPIAAIIVLAALAALRPAFAPRETHGTPVASASWPSAWEGTPLVAAPLLPVEAQFFAEFPGATAAFEDDTRRVVMRRVTQATRKLHPVAMCLRAGGFSVRPAPAWRHPHSGLWGVTRAAKDGRGLRVREQIASADGTRVWTDVSAWYWDALIRPQTGPWLAVTVIETDRDVR